MTAPTDPSMLSPPVNDAGPDGLLDLTSAKDICERLRTAGVPLTLQRLAVGQAMLTMPIHLTPDQVLTRARTFMPEISRATVYNTLKLFSEKSLVREVVVDSDRLVYDSNTSRHFHLYNVTTGVVTDIPAGDMHVVGSTQLPPDVEVEEIDVIIRVHNKNI